MKTFWLICAISLIAALLGTMMQAASRQSAGPTHSAVKALPLGDPAARGRGHNVFQQRCEICHYSGSVVQKVGPGLKGLYSRGTFAGGRKVDDAAVKEWILSGSKSMPPFKGSITPAQLNDLLSYLKSI